MARTAAPRQPAESGADQTRCLGGTHRGLRSRRPLPRGAPRPPRGNEVAGPVAPGLLATPGANPEATATEVDLVGLAWAVPWERERTRRVVAMGFEQGIPSSLSTVSGRPGLGLIIARIRSPRISSTWTDCLRPIAAPRFSSSPCARLPGRVGILPGNARGIGERGLPAASSPRPLSPRPTLRLQALSTGRGARESYPSRVGSRRRSGRGRDRAGAETPRLHRSADPLEHRAGRHRPGGEEPSRGTHARPGAPGGPRLPGTRGGREDGPRN